MKLQTKILLTVFPLVVVPLLALGGIAYYRLQQTATDTLMAQIATLLQQTAQQVHSFEQTVSANIHLFAASDMLRGYLLADEDTRYEVLQHPLLNLLTSYQKAYPDYIEIRVILPNGYEDARFALAELPNATEEEAETLHFQHWLAAGDSVYLNYLPNPDNQEYVLQVAKALKFYNPGTQERNAHSENTFRGFLVITLRLSHLKQQVEQTKIGNSGQLFFTDGNGTIRFHSEAEQNNQTLPIELQGLMRHKTEVHWHGTTDWHYQGVQLQANLWVFAQLPEAEFMQAGRGLGLAVAGIITITSFITLFLLLLLLHHLLIRPIKDLAHATFNLAEGRLDAYLAVRTQDEMGQLAQHFNDMALRLKTAQMQKDQAQAQALTNKEEAIENLKQADRLKDEFLANTSHELRTPLNGIIGIGQSLLDGIGGQPTNVQAQNLRMIVQSGQRLASLVNDILDAYKMRTKELQLQRRPIDMYAMTNLALSFSQTLVNKKSLELCNEVPNDLPPVYADENRLQQILLNLIGNAIKFTHSGRVTVSAELDAHQQMQIKVMDTGIGIPNDKLDIIFRAFEQADGSTARKYGGTGLGLSVTKQLVELHGGVIQVTSQIDQGSCFSFTLPLSDEQLVEQPVPDLPMISTDNLSPETIENIKAETNKKYALLDCNIDEKQIPCQVLIVDDEPINLQVLVNYLSIYNYELKLASSGQEVLDLLNNGYLPDIIILDVMMPHMTGFEVTQIIRETWQLHELPILLLTAKNQTQDIITGLEAGANDYLTKPTTKEELLARIRTHIAVKRLKSSRQAALETARLKSEFLANMSHEIRTPMNAIIGVSDLLNNTPLTAEQKEYVSTIRTGSETLLSLINDILDFSKIEAGKLELESQPFNLRACVEEALDLITSLAVKKDLSLAYWIDWDVPTQIIGDITRLRQTLVNLLSNAVKFTQQGDIMVKVSAQLLDSSSQLPIYEFLFSVCDTGVGISKAQQDKLFQSFSQVDSSITRRYGGTGLGLAICKRLTELMKGKIWLESEEGKGSTFFFNIQQAGIEKTASTPAWMQAEYFNGKQLLVLSDNASNRQILEQFFDFWSIKTQYLNLAEIGQERLQNLKPDCALVEIPTLKTKSQSIIEQLKRIKDSNQCALIVITSICHANLRSDLFAQCLAKPIRPALLFERLEQQFQHEQILTTNQPPTAQAIKQATPSSLRILLAEDNLVNQKVALLLLKRLGFQADIANNGLEAVKAIEEQTYDVVFMDMQMPEMDGLTATRVIREQTNHPEMPWIIAMTANAMEEDKKACFDAGMNDFISKPIRPQIIKEALQGVKNVLLA